MVHVRASGGVWACLGYVHAQNRGWQMDYLRRLFQGRLAEVLGYSALRSDFKMRLMGFREKAESLYANMSDAAKLKLRAYAEGVNHAYSDRTGGNGFYEFQGLGYRPEPWVPQDTLGVLLLQSFDQTRKGFQEELEESERLADHGELAQTLFDETGTPWDTSVLKPGEYPRSPDSHRSGAAPSGKQGGLLAKASPGLAKALDFDRLGNLGQGSNNWVVTSARSETGHAWLANDPHLNLKHPPFWQWVHIEEERGDSAMNPLNAIGASLPGVPLIVSGANLHMAWGLTNSYLDSAELIWASEGELGDSRSYRPWIWVKVLGRIQLPFFFKTFRRTARNWPILPIQGPSDMAAVLRWTGFELTGRDMEGLFEVMTARSVDEMDRKIADLGVPSWNFVFADTSGAIGYRANGKVFRRSTAPEYGVRASGLRELEALPILPSEEMPSLIRPARGYIATANNRQWPADAGLHGGRSYAPGFRAFRIEEMLLKTRRHDFESLKRIQCDIQAVDARFLLPLMLRQVQKAEKRQLQVFQDWDYDTTVDCHACALYRRWVDRVTTALRMDEAALFRALTSRSLEPVLTRELELAIRDLGSPSPNWGKVHRNFFEHLSRSSIWISGSSIAVPGDNHSVNPGSADWVEGLYRQHSGASHRLIVELSRPPTIHAALSGSNEDLEKRGLENEESDWMRWARCEYQKREFPFSWPARDQLERVMF